MDTENLVKKARAGDKAAFSRLYINHKDSLYRYAYFKLGNEHDAQDAVSACVVSAYTGLSALKSDRAFSQWLFKILYRECCAVLRQRSLRRDEESLDEAEELYTCDSNLAPELSEALLMLDSEEKDIVLLSAVAGYKSGEIAEMLGLNASTVRSKLSRGLAKMRKFLE